MLEDLFYSPVLTNKSVHQRRKRNIVTDIPHCINLLPVPCGSWPFFQGGMVFGEQRGI